MVVMVIWMHLVLVNNNITASSSEEKTLSSFLLYLRAYSLDGVSIGTAFFVFSPPSLFFSFSSSWSFKRIYTSFFFSFSFSSSRALGRSMLDGDHFACNLYCFLFFLFYVVLLLGKAHFSFLSRSIARAHTHIHKQNYTWYMQGSCISSSPFFFPFCSMSKRERVCLTFLLFCPHRPRALLAWFIIHIYVFVCREWWWKEREHNHQCDEDEDTTIIRWRWRILIAAWKERREREMYMCTL